jgi:hypothetical protein
MARKKTKRHDEVKLTLDVNEIGDLYLAHIRRISLKDIMQHEYGYSLPWLYLNGFLTNELEVVVQLQKVRPKGWRPSEFMAEGLRPVSRRPLRRDPHGSSARWRKR